MNTTDLISQVAELKTEVKYLKWIIPSACGFVALLILVFWNIERGQIGARISQALEQKGVMEAIDRTRNAADTAEDILGGIEDRAEEADTLKNRIEEIKTQYQTELNTISLLNQRVLQTEEEITDINSEIVYITNQKNGIKFSPGSFIEIIGKFASNNKTASVIDLFEIRKDHHWGGVFLQIEVFQDYYDMGYRKYTYINDRTNYKLGGIVTPVENSSHGQQGCELLNLEKAIDTGITRDNNPNDPTLRNAKLRLRVPVSSSCTVRLTGTASSVKVVGKEYDLPSTSAIKFLHWNF